MLERNILLENGITEYTADILIQDFQRTLSYKQEQARVFKILDAADHSDIWKIYKHPLPGYTQTPVYNPITVIRESTKASIMPTSYAADFRPTSMDAKQLAEDLNSYMSYKWSAAKMDSINSDAADYAFLHGTSAVLFGWDKDIVGADDIQGALPIFKKAEIQAKAIHPSNLFPDPNATSIEEASYVFISERKTKAFLKTIPKFADTISLIEEANNSMNVNDPNYVLDQNKNSDHNVVTFLTCYKKVLRANTPGHPELGFRVAVDIIYLAGRTVIGVVKDIQPNRIPIVTLYDERIPNNFWGISRCYKVLESVLTVNKLDSIEATSVIKNQNPAEFINAQAGLDIADYQANRGNPNKAYVVNIDPRMVSATTETHEIPMTLKDFKNYLIQGIKEVSGVDNIYQGSGFGSIQTTGGIQEAVNRSTLRDNVRIANINTFIREEVELILQFYVIHGNREQFFKKETDNFNMATGKPIDFDPAQLVGRQDIEIEVSATVPKTAQAYEDAAMKLMELNLKYDPSSKGYPDIITPEEVVSYLNIPKAQKRVMQERMALQYQNLKLQEYTTVLTAVGALTQGGMAPEMALQEIVTQIQQSKLGQIPAANVAPVPNKGTL